MDYDFQVFEFVGVNDDADFKRMMKDADGDARMKANAQVERKAYSTVDASQLVFSNRRSLDSLHSLQVIILLFNCSRFQIQYCLMNATASSTRSAR